MALTYYDPRGKSALETQMHAEVLARTAEKLLDSGTLTPGQIDGQRYYLQGFINVLEFHKEEAKEKPETLRTIRHLDSVGPAVRRMEYLVGEHLAALGPEHSAPHPFELEYFPYARKPNYDRDGDIVVRAVQALETWYLGADVGRAFNLQLDGRTGALPGRTLRRYVPDDNKRQAVISNNIHILVNGAGVRALERAALDEKQERAQKRRKW
ncbi:MAG: hypothetical protein AAGJ09_01660 [Pseudomonadota bacterium]